MGFEFDLQIEVDRKAFAALEQVIDSVESGRITPKAGREALFVLQTGFSGILEDNKGFHELLSETDVMFSNYPKQTDKSYIAYHKDKSGRSSPTYIVTHSESKIKVIKEGKIVSERTYDIPSECYSNVIKLHNKLIKMGLYNL